MSEPAPKTQGLIMLAVAGVFAIVIVLLWTTGDPPPTSLFWGEGEVEVVGYEVRYRGPGHNSPYLLVTARSEQGMEGTVDVFRRFQRDETGRIVYGEVNGRQQPVADLAPGDRLTVTLSSSGRKTTQGPGAGLIGAVMATVVGLVVTVCLAVAWRKAGSKPASVIARLDPGDHCRYPAGPALTPLPANRRGRLGSSGCRRFGGTRRGGETPRRSAAGLLEPLAPGRAGWGGRVRTSEWRNQNPLPYHLATPQSCRRAEISRNAAAGQSGALARCSAPAESPGRSGATGRPRDHDHRP